MKMMTRTKKNMMRLMKVVAIWWYCGACNSAKYYLEDPYFENEMDEEEEGESGGEDVGSGK
jgi:hypothetical protein